MNGPLYIVAFVPTLPSELRELFAEDIREFESGCAYVAATKVDFLGPFVQVELLPDEKKQNRMAWFQCQHVLAVGMGDFSHLKKLGFQP